MRVIGIIASSVQKAYAAFSDNFNRTTSGSLGTSSSNGLWTALRGVWFANGSSAQSNDAALTYPISIIPTTSDSVTASISTGEGSKLISATGTVESITSGNGTNGVTGFYWATITGMSSTTGINVGDWIFATNGTGSLYGGTPDYVEVKSVIDGTSITYRTKGGTVPTAGTVTNIYTRGKDGGSGVAIWVTDSGNWFGISYGRSIDTSCNCAQCLNGTYTCTTYGNSSYCGGYTSYCTSWVTNTAYTGYNQPNYDYASTGFSRVFSYTRIYGSTSYDSCNGSTASCTGGTYNTQVCTGSTQNSSACNCETCYPPYISVIKSVSNAVSEVSRTTLTSMAAAFKVITNATTKILTIRPYKEQAMTTQIDSDITSDLSAVATPTKKFGIVLTPSDQLQGKNLDNFNIG